MKKIITYICDVCRKDFLDEEQVYECEASHVCQHLSENISFDTDDITIIVNCKDCREHVKTYDLLNLINNKEVLWKIAEIIEKYN